MKKGLLIATGTVSLIFGVAGIFLPLLPTTPFLLLTAGCYSRSSSRLHDWLLNHRLFGNYIKSYQRFRAMPMKAKVISVSLLWVCIGSSAIFFVSNLWIRLLLLFIAVAVTYHILKLRTLTKQMLDELD